MTPLIHIHINYDEYLINRNTFYDDILIRFLSSMERKLFHPLWGSQDL